jgi:hypothetical protein
MIAASVSFDDSSPVILVYRCIPLGRDCCVHRSIGQEELSVVCPKYGGRQLLLNVGTYISVYLKSYM